jgi:hypothetical protein
MRRGFACPDLPKYSSGFHGRGTAKQGNDGSDRQEAIAKRCSASARP